MKDIECLIGFHVMGQNKEIVVLLWEAVIGHVCERVKEGEDI